VTESRSPTLAIETERLKLEPMKEEDLPAVLEVFLSNPLYLEWTEGGEYDLERLKLDWHLSQEDPARHMLVLREKATRELVGVIEYLELNERDGHPWIGLIIIGEAHQRRGFAAEAMEGAIERLAMGWASPVRIGVIDQNDPGMRLALSLGFTPYGRTEMRMNEDMQEIVLLERRH
jgi:RimJ/RimL family protein N-acetyltransferase